MYALAKIYKSKAQAVNAIRMTARNKDWKVLDTEQAEQHVWPAAEGFAVNNTTLNVAMGFAEAAEQDVSGAQESVAEALAEQAGKDKVIPQLPSRPAVIKSAADVKKSTKPSKAEKAPKATGEGNTRSQVVNGARRPLREGKTLDVWLTTERLQKETGVCPSCKEVLAALEAQHGSFNKTTCSIQFYACRTYNGWEVVKGSK